MDLFVKYILSIYMIYCISIPAKGQEQDDRTLSIGVFDDKKPEVDPNNRKFKEYVDVLTRFDDWVTGHTHIRGPKDILPDDEFNDPTPQTDPNNQAYKDYVDFLTRFDSWITGKKVPIPADPATDALHQDIGEYDVQLPSAQRTTNQLSGELIGFDDRAPVDPPSEAFNEYKNVLTRFDPWITGRKVPIPADPATDALHQVFRRSVISSEQSFADKFSDRVPANPDESSAYNDFVKKLKRFDPWITGQKVQIPRESTTDSLHQISI